MTTQQLGHHPSGGGDPQATGPRMNHHSPVEHPSAPLPSTLLGAGATGQYDDDPGTASWHH
jgi:hypothetical protein